MRKNLKQNYIFNLLYQVLSIIIPIIMIPYLSRTLHANGIGIYGYTISVVTYFLLFGSLGVNLYGQREVAVYQKDIKKRSKVFYELFFFKSICLLFTSILFFLFFCINNQYKTFYMILMLEFLSNILDISWLYQGLEEFKKIVCRNLIVKIFSIISIYIFVKTENDVDIYLLIYCLSNLVGNGLLWISAKKYLVKCDFKDLNFKTHLKGTILFFIPQIAIQVYAVLDKTMIGMILKDMTQVGYYESCQKVVRILMTVVTSLGIVMMPRIVSCISQNKTKEIKIYIKKSFSLVLCLSFPLMFGIIVVSPRFVPLFFGNGYEAAIPLLIVMSLIVLPVGISNITGNAILIARKMQKEYTISVSFGALINVILNYILILKFKALGAVISTVVSETVITFIQFNYCKDEIEFKTLLKLSKNYFVSSLVMFTVCFLIGKVNCNPFIILFFQVFIGIGIYVLMLILLKDDFFVGYLKMFLKYIKRLVSK